LPSDFRKTCSELGIELRSEEVKGGLFVDGERKEDWQIPDVDGQSIHW
jgi:hypothetical protein